MNQYFYYFIISLFILGFFLFQSSPSQFLENLNPKNITQEITTKLPNLKVSGQVVSGNQESTKIGFPTANLKIDSNIQLPPEFKTGLYLARTGLSSQAISIYNQTNQTNWSNYKEPEKKYLVYFHLSPSRDICYCYFPDLPTQVDLVNQRLSLEEITHIDSHLIDFIQSYHNHLDKTQTNNYVKTYYR